MKKLITTVVLLWCGFQVSAQTITITAADEFCYDNIQATLIGNDGGTPQRNIYKVDFPIGTSTIISWSSASNRWEIVYESNDTEFANTFASAPNPPTLGTGIWESLTTCGNLTEFSGSGTQTTLSGGGGGTPTPPPNDDLADAIELTTSGASHTVTSAQAAGATAETNESVCSQNNAWWYEFTPSSSGNATITAEVTGSTSNAGEDDTRLGIYTGTTHPLTVVTCTDDDDGAGYGEMETIAVTAGTKYYIRVVPADNSIIGDVTTTVVGSVFLPVELTKFQAKLFHKSVQLKWQTASEINNAGFEVERSRDGQDWQMFGFVEGEGSSQIEQSYTYLDTRPIKGLNYYRLKQIDFDGKFEYSNVISVRFAGEETIVSNFYPNPSTTTTTQIELELPDSDVWSVQLFDVTGKQVWQQEWALEKGTNRLELNLADLQPGLYFARIGNWKELIYRELVIQAD